MTKITVKNTGATIKTPDGFQIKLGDGTGSTYDGPADRADEFLKAVSSRDEVLEALQAYNHRKGTKDTKYLKD